MVGVYFYKSRYCRGFSEGILYSKYLQFTRPATYLESFSWKSSLVLVYTG